MALFRVLPNPRWRLAAKMAAGRHLEKFQMAIALE